MKRKSLRKIVWKVARRLKIECDGEGLLRAVSQLF